MRRMYGLMAAIGFIGFIASICHCNYLGTVGFGLLFFSNFTDAMRAN